MKLICQQKNLPHDNIKNDRVIGMETNRHQAAWNAIVQKIREISSEPGQTQMSVAKRLGIDRATIGRWISGERGGKHRTIDELIKYMKLLGIPPQQYLFDSPPYEQSSSRGIPVIGLAACGYDANPHDWFKKIKLALRSISPPPDGHSPHMFAVVATGSSMLPAGIKEGAVVFCDPDSTLEPDDIVFVEKKNNTSSIKMFRGFDSIWTILEGWTPPDEKGNQQLYTIREDNSKISRIVPVSYIKIKA